jgi:hypothetical protein
LDISLIYVVKPVFYEDWFRKGICFVNDIMSEDGKFLSIDQLEEKFNISKNIMKFNSIISAVKHAGNIFYNIFFYVRNITITKIE